MLYHPGLLVSLFLLCCGAFSADRCSLDHNPSSPERSPLTAPALAPTDARDVAPASVPPKTVVPAKDRTRVAGSHKPAGQPVVKAQLPDWLAHAFRKPKFSCPTTHALFCVWVI